MLHETFEMGKKNLWSTPLDYSVEYFWTTFGSLLEYHLSPVLMIVASFFNGVLLEYFWSAFGPLLEYPIQVSF